MDEQLRQQLLHKVAEVDRLKAEMNALQEHRDFARGKLKKGTGGAVAKDEILRHIKRYDESLELLRIEKIKVANEGTQLAAALQALRDEAA